MSWFSKIFSDWEKIEKGKEPSWVVSAYGDACARIQKRSGRWPHNFVIHLKGRSWIYRVKTVNSQTMGNEIVFHRKLRDKSLGS